MMMNTTVLDASGQKTLVSPSITPRAKPVDGPHDRSHAADHHHRENDDDQVGPHERRNLQHRGGQYTGKTGQGHAESVGKGDHARHIDAEGFNQLGVFGAGAQQRSQACAFEITNHVEKQTVKDATTTQAR